MSADRKSLPLSKSIIELHEKAGGRVLTSSTFVSSLGREVLEERARREAAELEEKRKALKPAQPSGSPNKKPSPAA